MNVLILINNGPNYLNFFYLIGKILRDKGYAVHYALTNRFPETKYNTIIDSYNKFYLSDYHNMPEIEQIKNYEEKYNLRKLYFPDFDRHEKYNYDYQNDIYMDQYIIKSLSFFEELITTYNISYVIYENVSNVFSYACYLVTRKYNIEYIGLCQSRLPDRFDIWFDDYGNCDKIEKDFYECNIGKLDTDTKKYIKSYFEHLNDMEPYYKDEDHKHYKNNYQIIKRSKAIIPYIRYLIRYKNDINHSYELTNPIRIGYQYVKRILQRKFRIQLLQHDFFDYINEEDCYYLYPIHFQPEATTSVNARYYTNQYEMIKNIAFSLPLNTMLYVKEHPHAYGCFPISFYKQIKKIPNVKFIHCDESVVKLIINCEGVITLTGTMGFEALMYNKPAISFGEIFYNCHPYCFHLTSFEELYDTIKNIKDIDINKFREYNEKLLYAYFKNTYDGKIFLDDPNKSDIKKIITSICTIFKT